MVVPITPNMAVDMRLRSAYMALKNDNFDSAQMYIDLAIEEINLRNPEFATEMIGELNIIHYFISCDMRTAAHDRLRDLHYRLVETPDNSTTTTHHKKAMIIKAEIKTIDPSLLPTTTLPFLIPRC
jgi:hypothetical protein